MRNGRAALAAVLLVACFGLVAGGCGGGDVEAKNDYVAEVNRVQEEFASTFERLAGEITATSTAAEDRKTLAGFQTAVDETVADLGKVKPPDEVKTLHQDLVDEISGYGEAITKAEQGFSSSASVEQLTKAQAELAESTAKTSSAVNQTITEINTKLRE
jgi:hypothetical protein